MKTTIQSEWRQSAVRSLILFALVIVISAVPLIRDSQQRLSDTYFRLNFQHPNPSPFVIVLIDDDSLRQYGRWPWSREVLARLVTRLDQSNAGVIGLDILLAEPQSPPSDGALEEAIRSCKRVVLVDKVGAFPDGPRWSEPIDRLSHAALAVGHAQALLDVDGVCRRFPAYELTLDGPRWAFALEVAKHADASKAAYFLHSYGIPHSDSGVGAIFAKPILVPIAFTRHAFETVSAASVLNGNPPRDFGGRPVLVGLGPTELGDRIITPISGQLPSPGIEVHAQILDGILTERKLHALPLLESLLLLAAVCLFVVWQCRRWRGARSLVSLSATACVIYVFGFVSFWLGAILPIGQLVLAIVAGPVLSFSSDTIIVERSLLKQLRELRGWLEENSPVPSQFESGLSWRLDLLSRLQERLGSLYELHDTLLRTTQDCIAVFDEQGRLLLKNAAFEGTFPSNAGEPPSLEALRQKLRSSAQDSAVAGNDDEGEVLIGEELYSYRAVPMPATAMSPGGGTVIRLTSLHLRVERDRARAEALGFVTHELRTPLVAIQGFSELMMKYPSSPAYARAPETIFNESKRLLALINSYLDVLRVDAGARPIGSDVLHLNDLVRRILDILQPLAEATNMRMTLVSGDDVQLTGDEHLVSGAILNLISNAIKYGKPGTEVSASTAQNGNEATLVIHNFGEPISSEDLARVFDPYYRGAKTAAEQTGWGLGLAFVKRIADKHGGSIHVASDLQSGTTFRLCFPAVLTESVQAGERS